MTRRRTLSCWTTETRSFLTRPGCFPGHIQLYPSFHQRPKKDLGSPPCDHDSISPPGSRWGRLTPKRRGSAFQGQGLLGLPVVGGPAVRSLRGICLAGFLERPRLPDFLRAEGSDTEMPTPPQQGMLTGHCKHGGA